MNKTCHNQECAPPSGYKQDCDLNDGGICTGKTPTVSLALTKIEYDTASCNVCYARNYDATDAIGSRVDAMYRLQIGSQGVTLCAACRRRVAAVLTQNI